jgi:hypothetical protein
MNGGKYFTLLITLFLTLVVVLKLGLRVSYKSELILFFILLISSLVILKKTYDHKSYDLFASIVFFVSIINLFYIKSGFLKSSYVNVGFLGWSLFGLTFLFNGISFIISTTSIKKHLDDFEKDEIKEEIIEPKINDAKEELKQTSKKTSKSFVKKTYSPGKFVASSNASTYHIPKCAWAKKINSKNRVWFDSKDQARKKGYKQHSCLKK